MNRIHITDIQGIGDWQIIQQNEHGMGSLRIQGTLYVPENDPERNRFAPAVRLVSESTSAPASPETNWQRTASFDLDSGRFEHELSTIPAGGLYRLEIGIYAGAMPMIARMLHTVHAIGVGDLWVIAGQSNAAGIGAGTAEDAPELGVHLLHNNENWMLAMHPLNDPGDSHHPNTEGRAQHSPYLAFAKQLKRELNYPIGLIQTSLGGSPLSLWNPAEDGTLYQNMLHCIHLAGGGVKGILWYQGCSDTGSAEAATYSDRFTNFVTTLREDLKAPELPLITTQLNRHAAPPDAVADAGWSQIRESQRLLARNLTAVAVVPALGLPLSDGIHNSTAGNLELGARYATTALGMVYDRNLPWRFPEIAGITKAASTPTEIKLRFTNVTGTLALIADLPTDFQIRDDQGQIAITAAAIDQADTLTLTLQRAPATGARISSAYGRNPLPTLFDYYEHRPALAFTDIPI